MRIRLGNRERIATFRFQSPEVLLPPFCSAHGVSMALRTLKLDNAASLVTALELIGALTADDRAALTAVPLRFLETPAGEDLVREGERPTESCLLLSGILCRYKTVFDGRRQILSFHLPGEIPDLQSLYLERMDHSLGAITPVRVGFIAHHVIDALYKERPTLGAAMWRATLVDASIFREWLAGVGRRSAAQRMAHLFCELCLRMRMLGLAHDGEFEMPLTQPELADALGLTPVHVSRTLTLLRAEGLVELKERKIAILDWKALAAFADFDPTYLHYRKAIPEDLR